MFMKLCQFLDFFQCWNGVVDNYNLISWMYVYFSHKFYRRCFLYFQAEKTTFEPINANWLMKILVPNLHISKSELLCYLFLHQLCLSYLKLFYFTSYLFIYIYEHRAAAVKNLKNMATIFAVSAASNKVFDDIAS